MIMGYNASAASGDPLVSVYCMTYNQENTIAETIESIVSQKTDFSFELIVHDDASTDGTAAIVRDYAERYPHIIRPVLQQENQFKKCNIIKTHINPIAKGEYVALCEGDDYWSDESKLQIQIDHMRKNPDCSFCFHAVHQLSPDGKMMIYRPLKSTCDVPASLIIKRGGLFCPTVSSMFRRDVMNIWPDFRNEADVYDYPAQVLAATMGKVHYIDHIMGVYRFASEGSWTAQHAGEIDYTHVENETRWLEKFNAYSENRYADAINYHMAHMWFTEFRKTFESSVRKNANHYIRQLPFGERAMFTILMFAFSLLGKRGNNLWQAMKKILLK